jgi:hypothetical protein
MKKLFILLVILLFSLHLFLLINLKFTAWPEMFSFPYLRNSGFLIYKDMIHPYPPLLTMALSMLYEVLGYNLIVLKIFTWVLVLFNDLIIILLVKKITKKYLYALLALLFYVLTQPLLEGNMLWFDLACLSPLLVSLYFSLSYLVKKKGLYLLWAGIFLTVAALIKQTAGLYFLGVIIFLLLNKTKIKSLLNLFIGPLLLGIPLLVRLLQEGALNYFLNWVFVYPFSFWTKFPGYVRMDISKNSLLLIFFLIIPVLIILFINFKKIIHDRNILLVLMFFLLGLVCVYPRFSFFHFQTALGFLAILIGVLLSQFKIKKSYGVTSLIIGLIAFLILVKPIILRDWQKEPRFYGKSDLDNAKIISNIIKNDKVYLLGLNSSLYTFSRTLPPKRWFDNYGWYLEVPGVQEEILARWKLDLPKYVFWKEPDMGPWYEIGVYQPAKIASFVKANYNRKGEPIKGVSLWVAK